MKNIMLWLLLLLSISVRCFASTDFESHSIQAIEDSIEDFLRSELQSGVTVQISPLDSRLRLVQCLQPLSHRWTGTSSTLGRVTIQTGCESEKPWRIHVQATLSKLQEIWTLTRAVRRGETLTTEMGEKKEIVIGGTGRRVVRANLPVDNINAVIGYEFLQDIDAGSVLTQRMLKPKTLVSKGERVLIRYSSAGIKLQAQGIAVTDGAFDQRIQIKNTSSGKIIDARVMEHGIAEALH